MHVLFVHQNFPAQFRYIAPRLIRDYGWTCSFCMERVDCELPGVRKIRYSVRGGATMANSLYTRNFENAVAHANAVFEAMKQAKDLQPDLIVAHSGFGSSLFLPFLYDAPIINFLANDVFIGDCSAKSGRLQLVFGHVDMLANELNHVGGTLNTGEPRIEDQFCHARRCLNLSLENI
jgi:hypothetical protein